MTWVHVLLVSLVCVHMVEASIWSKAMENEDLFEGDIVLRPNEKQYGGIVVGMRWPGGIVPYDYDKDLDPKAIPAIEAAFEEYKRYTCIRFKKRTNEKEYLHFYKGGGCSSPIGFPGKGYRNRISIGDGCYHRGIVQHEIGHSLGKKLLFLFTYIYMLIISISC